MAFIDLYRNAVISRQIYEWQKMTRPEALTDLERAVRYYYLQRLAFGGKVEGRTFGTSTTSAPRLDVLSIQSNLTEIHQRIARVTIEHLDGTDCIRRYDRPHTLFFVDPPYYHTAGYAVAFPDERYTELAQLLEGIKGKFLLTINAVDEMRDVFRAFTIKEVGTSYSIAKADARSPRVTELLIRNF